MHVLVTQSFYILAFKKKKNDTFCITINDYDFQDDFYEKWLVKAWTCQENSEALTLPMTGVI